MFPRADINGTRPVTAIEAPRPTASIADARHEVLDRLNQIAIGKMMRAQVLSRLTDGSFMVKLADTAVRMNLPGNAQAGDALDLTLIATQPRLTFLLGGPARDPGASLSRAGRLIDTVLRAAQKEGAPTTLVGKAPLVQSPAATPAQLATALKDTLTLSGLFYESHVQQWVNGERTLTELMREPQAKHSDASLIAVALRANAEEGKGTTARIAAQPAADLAGADGDDAHAAARPGTPDMHASADDGPSLMHAIRMLFSSGIPAQTAPPAAPAPAAAQGAPSASGAPNDATGADGPPATPAAEGAPNAKPGSAQASARAAETSANASTIAAKSTLDGLPADAGLQARAETMNSESVRMISLQLDTFEQRRVAWQGELWPGQPMEWEVTEDTPHGAAASDAERSWQSVVRFELPVLGNVSATIRLTGNRLQVQVKAVSEATASLLREHGAELSSALDAAGSPLDLFTVKQDETA